MSGFWSRVHADVARHEGWSDPAVWPLLVHRFGRSCKALPDALQKVASKVYGAAALGVELATGTRLDRETQLGEGLHLVHGRNVHVHPNAVLGERVTLMHDVTIGTGMNDSRVPVLEDDVFVGAGAKILGGVRIGRGARIAANSLVITDIPAGAHAMGVPARPFPTRLSSMSRPPTHGAVTR